MKKISMNYKFLSILLFVSVFATMVGVQVKNWLATSIDTTNEAVHTGHVEGETASQNGALFNPLPSTIDELVSSSDIIISGYFDEIINQGNFYGYGPEAVEIEAIDKETTNRLSVPFIDYSIRIDAVLDGEASREVIFRVVSDLDSIKRNEETMFSSGKKLMFLTQNPDGETYGISSSIHLVDIEGLSPLFYQEGRALKPFNFNKTIDLLNSIVSAVAEQA